MDLRELESGGYFLSYPYLSVLLTSFISILIYTILRYSSFHTPPTGYFDVLLLTRGIAVALFASWLVAIFLRYPSERRRGQEHDEMVQKLNTVSEQTKNNIIDELINNLNHFAPDDDLEDFRKQNYFIIKDAINNELNHLTEMEIGEEYDLQLKTNSAQNSFEFINYCGELLKSMRKSDPFSLRFFEIYDIKREGNVRLFKRVDKVDDELCLSFGGFTPGEPVKVKVEHKSDDVLLDLENSGSRTVTISEGRNPTVCYNVFYPQNKLLDEIGEIEIEINFSYPTIDYDSVSIVIRLDSGLAS